MTPSALGRIGKHERIMLDYFAGDALSLSGSFARFTHIDPNSPWWDAENRAAILDESGNPVPQVRRGIGPNLEHIYFSFIPESHLLVFDTRHISPKQFARGLQEIVSRDEITSQFGEIGITVVPKHDDIDKLLMLPRKRQIRVVITLPNGPDVPDTLEGRIKVRYERMNVRKAETVLVGQTDHNIEVDAELRAAVNVAATNGFAEVSYVGDSGVLETKSTKDYPRKEKDKCYPDKYWASLRWLAAKFTGNQREHDANGTENITQ
jgi:hypothetical protein